MTGSLSIIEKKRFANCRLCDTLVSSDDPTCSKCGLEMSREGIIEIADLEDDLYEVENQGFVGVYSLRFIAIISLAMTIIAFIYATFFHSPTSFKYFCGSGLLLYILAYSGWNKEYLKQQFGIDETEIITREKRISLIIFLFSFTLGAILYGYL